MEKDKKENIVDSAIDKTIDATIYDIKEIKESKKLKKGIGFLLPLYLYL